MKTFIHLQSEKSEPLPEEFAADDVRFPPSLVELFLGEFTLPGDLVFDPFAGFGTTLLVAEAMGRKACGLEFDPSRCRYARSRLRDSTLLLHGDARKLSTYQLPAIDFTMTSPPYTTRNDLDDALAAYTSKGSGYAAYLADMRAIYRQVAAFMREGARAVVEIANIKGTDGVTTLAWDVAEAIGHVLRFDGEVVVAWEPTYGYGYDHSYCLIFSKPQMP